MPPPIDPRLLRRATAVRIFLVAAVAVGTATAMVVVAQAWLLSRAIAELFHSHRTDVLVSTAPWLLATFAARALLSWLSTVLAARTAATVKSKLRFDLVRSRLENPQSGQLPTGSFVTLVGQGLDALDGYFSRYLPQLVLAVTVPLVVGVAIWTADPLSAIIVAATLPLIPIFMILIGLSTQALTRRRWRVQSRLAHHFADLVSGLPTLQVFGRAKAQAEGLRLTGERHRIETLRVLRISFLSALVLELLATLSVALVAVGIGLRVVDGHLTLAIGLFVLILAPEAFLPVRQVGVHYHDAADGIAAADQVFTVLGSSTGVASRQPGDRLPQRSTEPIAAPESSGALVELIGVAISYPGRAAPVVDGFDLVIRPGETVALVGPSGSGKSSILSVLMGFLAPETGQVLVAGQPLNDLDLRAWRRRVAWVGQEPRLLRGTILDNVAMGAPGAPRGRVVAALAAAGAGDLDPDRDVGECGEGLSTGEVRRVALARALLRIDCGGGQLLILDEPTAGLDAETELVAIDSLRRLGVSTLVVTHRDAVARLADRTCRLGGSRLEVIS